MENYDKSPFYIPDPALFRKRFRVLTWHIHGSYLFYLSQGNYEICIPVKDFPEEGYYGRGETFPFGPNVREIHVRDLPKEDFDVILFQSPKNYLHDQYEILTEEQRKLPRIYLEHDPPRQVPTETSHPVDDPEVLLVHVTHFNCLMWNNNRTPTRVIDHGVMVPDIPYTGEKARGIVVINNLEKRGRRLGADIFEAIRREVPVDLIGMGSDELGLGEVRHPELPAFISQYRFFLNPIRYTSLGLSVLEAMMLGIPVVGLATTEMVTVIRNGVSGVLHTDVRYLIEQMKRLIREPDLAAQLGAEGKKVAAERFNIRRFTADWEETFAQVVGRFQSSAISA